MIEKLKSAISWLSPNLKWAQHLESLPPSFWEEVRQYELKNSCSKSLPTSFLQKVREYQVYTWKS